MTLYLRNNKPVKIMPIVIDFARGFGAWGLKADDVGGEGLRTDDIERKYGNLCARFAYSNVAPGLLVAHYLDFPLDGPHKRILSAMKFYYNPHLGIRRATAEWLRPLINYRVGMFQSTKTEEDVEADFLHLLEPPSDEAMEKAWYASLKRAEASRTLETA
jgi:hypothetical protein